MRRLALRVLAVLTVLTGFGYLVWRWWRTVAWDAWWVGVPLALAETSTLVATTLLALTMWRIRRRPAPAAPARDLTVDVLVTTDDEPVDVVMRTVAAARDIRYPHRTWVLDDGSRPELRIAAGAAGVEYLERSADWTDRPRHAKAGNLNNALFRTDGELLLVLEADRVPVPEILDRTLGHFADDRVALVQSPREGSGFAAADPLDALAPMLPGPVQEGKDGWGAPFSTGSDVLLRRDALMQLGLVGYVRETERTVRDALNASRRLLENARRAAPDPAQAAVLAEVEAAAGTALAALAHGGTVTEVTFAFQRDVDRISASVVAGDVSRMQADLRALGELPIQRDEQLDAIVVDDAALARLAQRDWSPLGAISSVQALIRAVDVGRSDEAQPVLPVPTTPVTEDVATAVHLYALGWRTVYHDEQLTHGPAADLGTTTGRRLRWAQGTLQALLAQDPATMRRLRPGQRLMCLAAGWAYLAGFAALVYLAVPIVFLTTGVSALSGWDVGLAVRFGAYAVAGQLLVLVAAGGPRRWRGLQHSIALFPVWVRAAVTAAADVWWHRPLRAVRRRTARAAARPQRIATVLLVLAAAVGVVRAGLGRADWTVTAVHLVWVGYLVAVLSVVLQAGRRGARTASPTGTAPAATEPAEAAQTAPTTAAGTE
ncbi:MAG TPA: glycosyltransferase [Cellulomonas sp.]